VRLTSALEWEMNNKKKVAAKQGQTQVTVRPRLVKAGEVAAREAAVAAEAERRAQTAVKEPAINPALKRTPRNAVEARDMFKALFNEEAA
jgi:hypothetical protein